MIVSPDLIWPSGRVAVALATVSLFSRRSFCFVHLVHKKVRRKYDQLRRRVDTLGSAASMQTSAVCGAFSALKCQRGALMLQIQSEAHQDAVVSVKLLSAAAPTASIDHEARHFLPAYRNNFSRWLTAYRICTLPPPHGKQICFIISSAWRRPAVIRTRGRRCGRGSAQETGD